MSPEEYVAARSRCEKTIAKLTHVRFKLPGLLNNKCSKNVPQFTIDDATKVLGDVKRVLSDGTSFLQKVDQATIPKDDSESIKHISDHAKKAERLLKSLIDSAEKHAHAR